jgi:hypothetical protein
VYQREAEPVYVWELDTTQVSAGRLLSHRHLLHDISTALGGGVRVHWKNHVGLGLVFDERPAPRFPAQIPLPKPPGRNYLLPFGVDIHSQAVWRSLRETKNIVIAGGTQYGKTAGLRGWLTALTRQHSPDELRLAMVDGKDFEFVGWEGSPYLANFMAGRVATEVTEAQAVTTTLATEIQARRRVFREHRVRTGAALAERTGQRLPVIVLVIDELRDLLDAGFDPTDLQRILQQGAGLDIYVIVGTQRPDAETVKKSNFATIVSYRLANTAESQVVFTNHEPYHTLKASSPGECVVLGPGLDYAHLKSFWVEPEAAMSPEVVLSEMEKILVRVAVIKNGGSCAVGRISAIIRQELPGRYWQAGGPFTYHRLQETFKQWEARGWLTPAGLDTGRMVTPERRRLDE